MPTAAMPMANAIVHLDLVEMTVLNHFVGLSQMAKIGLLDRVITVNAEKAGEESIAMSVSPTELAML